MKSIQGIVLEKETNVGIPNLVVAAFDSELVRRDAQKGKLEIYQLPVDEFGKRIGSVLTDRDGRFLLTAEDLQFEGVESRPDLILAVFAPEDVQDINIPSPLKPEKKILYVSAVPRNDAGAEEAYVIRLLREQLDKFGITRGFENSKGESSGDKLADMVEETWAFRDKVKEKTSQRLEKENNQSEQIRMEAKEKMKKLSGLPLHLRDNENAENDLRNNRFLIMNKQDLTDQLSTVQRAAIRAGIANMDKKKPSMRLNLTEKELKDFGLKVKDGTITGKIDSATLLKKAREMNKGVDLIRIRALNNPSPDELEKKYLGGD